MKEISEWSPVEMFMAIGSFSPENTSVEFIGGINCKSKPVIRVRSILFKAGSVQILQNNVLIKDLSIHFIK